MGWQDRPYYRDRGDTSGNPLMWALTGSIPLFTAFGIRVRAHASLVLCVALVLLFGLGQGFTWQDRVESMSLLFLIVLLHEFGHCFAARAVGGSAEDILMSPLGGLAMAHPPHRWLPTFITVAAGPAVNVVICLGCGAILWVATGWLPWNPLNFHAADRGVFAWFDFVRYAFWMYSISYFLLVFNLLPIWPLDGGQMLHAVLWKWLGHYKATLIACAVGIVGSILMLGVAIPTRSLLLGFIAASCLMNCINQRRMTVAMGPEEFADETDYSAAYEPATPRRRRSRLSQRAIKKARKLAVEARLEQERIDQILAKVSAHGMASLTWSERRALRKATEHRRKRDLELSQ
jgi:stage IV sporulation protein FB